jgi:hypothetical protein
LSAATSDNLSGIPARLVAIASAAARSTSSASMISSTASSSILAARGSSRSAVVHSAAADAWRSIRSRAADGRLEAVELYTRIETIRLEIEAIRMGRRYASREELDPEWIGLPPWESRCGNGS